MAATEQSDHAKEVVQDLLRNFSVAEVKRSNFNAQWEKVAKLVLPYYQNSFFNRSYVSPGQERGQETYESTANSALGKFAACRESRRPPGNGRGHRLRPVDPTLKRDRGVMTWFDQVTDLMFHYRYSPHSGFQANVHSGYVSVGAFGTGCLYTDAFHDPTRPGMRGLRYRQCHLGEVFFAENHQGQVDCVYRRFRMTLRQIAQKWGKDKLPESLASKLADHPEDEVYVVHAVRPNAEYEPGRLDRRGMRFSSHYILADQNWLLDESGYHSMPYSVARYLVAPGEVYGRSPAMNVLPSIKTLNEEKRVVLKEGQRAVEPVLLAHDDGVADAFNLRSGAINSGAVSADGKPLVHVLPTGNMQIGKELMDDERYTINDAYLVTLFQILVDPKSGTTATEVMERAREKGILLSPTMGRYQTEGLGPMIEREFDVLMQQGLLPPPPQKLVDAGAGYMVEYDAPLNRAMRAEEAAGIMRSAQYAGEIANLTQDPSPMDWFDWDTIMPELIDINGAPFRFMASPEQVAAKRQSRNADKTAAQLTQAMPGMAAMQKAMNPNGALGAR